MRFVDRRRAMALCFALGSTCFLVGPFPSYVQLVGAAADGITFFVGSILFTAGGALQSWLAWPERRMSGGGRAAWWSAPNWNTSLGAACFLACAVDTLRTGKASKMTSRREFRALEHALERELEG